MIHKFNILSPISQIFTKNFFLHFHLYKGVLTFLPKNIFPNFPKFLPEIFFTPYTLFRGLSPLYTTKRQGGREGGYVGGEGSIRVYGTTGGSIPLFSRFKVKKVIAPSLCQIKPYDIMTYHPPSYMLCIVYMGD